MAFGQISLKGRALRLLSQREHSRSELACKLARHVVVDDDADPHHAAATTRALIEQTIADLAEHGFVSDERTADSVLNVQGSRFGLLKIRQTLHAKGLAPELVAATMAKARATEFETALRIWQRKYGQAPRNAKERAFQQRFLAARGFSAEAIGLVFSTAAKST